VDEVMLIPFASEYGPTLALSRVVSVDEHTTNPLLYLSTVVLLRSTVESYGEGIAVRTLSLWL